MKLSPILPSIRPVYISMLLSVQVHLTHNSSHPAWKVPFSWSAFLIIYFPLYLLWIFRCFMIALSSILHETFANPALDILLFQINSQIAKADKASLRKSVTEKMYSVCCFSCHHDSLFLDQFMFSHSVMLPPVINILMNFMLFTFVAHLGLIFTGPQEWNQTKRIQVAQGLLGNGWTNY